MSKKHSSSVLSFYQETFNELYKIDSLIQVTRTNCESIEFSGQYYGIPAEMISLLSAERNNYINILTILSERVSNIIDKGILLENEILSTIEHQQLQLTDNNSKSHI